MRPFHFTQSREAGLSRKALHHSPHVIIPIIIQSKTVRESRTKAENFLLNKDYKPAEAVVIVNPHHESSRYEVKFTSTERKESQTKWVPEERLLVLRFIRKALINVLPVTVIKRLRSAIILISLIHEL